MPVITDNQKIINELKELGEKLDKTNELLAGILEISQRLEKYEIEKEQAKEESSKRMKEEIEKFNEARG